MKKNIENYDQDIDEEILKYIATNIKSNIRELEGALRKVIASSRLNNTELSLSLAEDALKDIIYPEAPKEITPELIMNIVAEHFNISASDIASSKRNSEIVMPRQIYMYLCRELIDIPYKSIGKTIGNKDHTTVMHGVDKIKKEMEGSEDLRNKIDIIKKKINPA